MEWGGLTGRVETPPPSEALRLLPGPEGYPSGSVGVRLAYRAGVFSFLGVVTSELIARGP
jgi:hypothetical protein